MIRHSKYHNIDSAIIFGLAVLSVILLSNFTKIHKYTEKKVNIIQKIPSDIIYNSVYNQEAFSKINIEGRAYVVYDIVDQKVISQKNGDTILPLASITKIMTAISARMHNYKRKQITIMPISIDGTYDLGLKKGQVWELDELLKYTLVFSSNDGAQAVADGLGGRKKFISQMNNDAKLLGLQLYFTNPAGLDENGKLGGEGSAISIAKLVQIANKQIPELFDVTTKTRANVNASTGRLIGIPNTNQDVNNLRGIVLSKTGFTDVAGGNLVVIVDISIGHPVAIVVLGSTREGRFRDVEKLYNALQNSIKR